MRLRCRPRCWLTALRWIHQWVRWPPFTCLRCHTQQIAGRPPSCCITAETTRPPPLLTSSLCASLDYLRERVRNYKPAPCAKQQITTPVLKKENMLLVYLLKNAELNRTDYACIYSSILSVFAGLMYVTHYMDNNVTNPFKLWENMGSPDYPTAQQFTQLRSQEVPHTHTHTHTHTHVGFYGLRGLSIGVMVFILYKLYVLLPYT